jgi:hypothetical protein
MKLSTAELHDCKTAELLPNTEYRIPNTEYRIPITEYQLLILWIKYYICPVVLKYYSLSIFIIVVLDDLCMLKKLDHYFPQHIWIDERRINLTKVV